MIKNEENKYLKIRVNPCLSVAETLIIVYCYFPRFTDSLSFKYGMVFISEEIKKYIRGKYNA